MIGQQIWKKCLAGMLIFLLLPFSGLLVLPAFATNGQVTTQASDLDPKSGKPKVETQRISVEKVWKDEGNTAKRPDKVTVDLKYGSQVHSTAVLNQANGWKFLWQNLPLETKDKKWTVVERPVAGYAGSLQESCATGQPIDPNISCLDKKVVLTSTYQVPKPTDPAAPTDTASPGTSETPNTPKDLQGKTVDVRLEAKVLLNETPVAANEASLLLKDAKGTVVQTKTSGAKGIVFDALTFDKTGTYTYTITEEKGTAPDISYDESVYEVRVTVQEKNGALLSDTLTFKDGVPSTGTPTFYHTKTFPGHLTVKKEWADPDNKENNRPVSVSVQLFKDGAAEGDFVVLNEENTWQHTFTDLEPGYTWTVDETAVPKNYTKQVATNDDVVTISNTYVGEIPVAKPVVVPSDQKNTPTTKTPAAATTTRAATTTKAPTTKAATTRTATKTPAKTVPRTGSMGSVALPLAGLVLGMGGAVGVAMFRKKK